LLGDDGKLSIQGWQINAENLIQDNSPFAVGTLGHYLRSFHVLALFIDTPDHFLFVTTPAIIMGSVCVTQVVILDKSDPRTTRKKVESMPICPAIYERDSLFYFDGKGVENDRGDIKIKVGKKDKLNYTFSLQVESLGLKMEADMSVNHDSMMWLTPLSDDKTRYFATIKKSGLPLNAFSYTYDGEVYDVPQGKALITIDSATSMPNYGMSYFFAIMQGQTEDGTNVGLLMQDGIGSQYSGTDRATEDSITVNGKAYKLDRTNLLMDYNDPMAPRRL
jgi:hypothetical protein